MADAPENQPEKQPLQSTDADKAISESVEITADDQADIGKKADVEEFTENTVEDPVQPDDVSAEERTSSSLEMSNTASVVKDSSADKKETTPETNSSSETNDVITSDSAPSAEPTETLAESEEESTVEVESSIENAANPEPEKEEANDQISLAETEQEESASLEEISKSEPETSEATVVATESDESNSSKETLIDTSETAQNQGATPTDGQSAGTESVAQPDEGDTDEADEDTDESSEAEAPDYSQFSREELAREMEKIAKGDDVRSITDQIREIKVHFDELEEVERQKALEQFISEGGEKDGFEYRPDEYYTLFYAAYDKIRERRTQQRAEREKNRQQNLKLKEEILNKLRDFVDSEETQVSISKLKEIQEEWKSVGEVPSSHNRTLWANYHALLDRFYDNRSIYFELKELDRKKNLESKTTLAERAEQLVDEPDIKKATQELDELHEEYKHIGPVPRDEQEALWQRFKAASDKIHDRRRADVEAFKEQLKENLVEKQKLVEQVKEFASFESDSIKEWNKKTKEIQQLQKQWDAAGSMPRNQAKEVNRKFWSSFKEFFAHKGEFFKRLDALREENLKKKEELVEKAESLKDSDDWKTTSNELKRLQREWKDIGPVPEKFRETVYQRFKAACDEFFERRRNNSQETEVEYQKNLKNREEICEKIEQLAQEKSSDLEAFTDLTQQYSNTGFVPRGAIKSISERYQAAVSKFLANAEELDESQKQEVQVSIELGSMKSGPGAGRRLNQKEGNVRRQISRLEDDIAVWKNNISFFTSSFSPLTLNIAMFKICIS